MPIKIISIIFIFTTCFQVFVTSLESRRNRSTYVGIYACKKCHDSESIGSQHKIWAASPHAKAYQTLESVKAKHVAAMYKIKNPTKEKKCLKCHSTGGGRNLEIVREGVGCEACHGPGSRYYDFDNHASFDNKANAYKKAIRLGMYPIIGDDSIKAREKLCRHCHNSKRLCITDEDRSNKKYKPLPLSIIADFIYKHPLR